MTGPVVVVGDVMLDIFEEGRVERISPEAPVPILHNPSAREVLGGGANSALNVHTLGLPVRLVGFVGRDRAGGSAVELTEQSGIENALTVLDTWPTIVKQRFLAHGQQILRVDYERRLEEDQVASILPRLETLLAGCSGVVLSDYDKGAISDAVARACVGLANDLKVPCVVDSKRVDPSVFRGCTVLAPNLLEAERMAGSSVPAVAARRIAAVTDSAVLVTLGPEGMLLHANGEDTRIHSKAQEVVDVTGAGDSVTAGLVVSLARGDDIVTAATYSSHVAAVAVAHQGTYPVSAQDVEWAPAAER